jgi:acetaldehyde dehydrogenase/alcohol dehydrogenase
MYRADDFADAVAKASALVELGGMGHTASLYTADANTALVDHFQAHMKAGRVLVNTPASHGAIGDIFNFKLEPSLTLGCGSWGGNSVSENVGAKHLLNIKTVAFRRENTLWFRVPPKVFFKRGSVNEAFKDLAGNKRAFVVTDRVLKEIGVMDKVTNVLEAQGIAWTAFYEVEPDPTLATVRKGLAALEAFKPDVIIALGGGSPIDAAKVMWHMYEHPALAFEDIAMRFMDIRKRICAIPEGKHKAIFVAVPTTSGTGSEVTPFAVITDEKTGIKYPLADYALTPDMAVVDPDFVMAMPKKLAAYSGLDAVTHAIEALASVVATEFTDGIALEALRLLFTYLPRSVNNGASDPEAREKIHYASTMAGMAFANAFLGICHSMAHKMGSALHLPHGLANALLINEVIKYNATEDPEKMPAFAQYKYPQARERYARIADYLGLGGDDIDAKVVRLTAAIDKLKVDLDVPLTIRAAGVDEAAFALQVPRMSELAFDDQCTGANPRYPLVKDLEELYLRAYFGT